MGFDPAESVDFSDALHFIRCGVRMTRRGWKGKQKFIKLMLPTAPDECSWLAIVYPVQAAYPAGMRSPWTPTRCDLLESDWIAFVGDREFEPPPAAEDY